MVLADAIDGSAVHEQPQEYVQVQLVDRFLIVFQILRKPNLILHVLDFLLGGVESHAPHHVCYGLKRDLAIQLSCFCRVLIFRPNLTVVKEIF